MSLTVGQKAPDFKALDDEGNERSLADFAGKTLVLYFYPKDNTPGCTREAQDFRDLGQEFADRDVAIVGVSKDSVASHQKFKAKHELPFTLLSDPEGKLIDDYGAWKEKLRFGKTFMGIARTTVVVDADGIVQKVFPNVKVNGHAEKVLQCVIPID